MNLHINFSTFMVVLAIFSRELGKGSLFGIDFDWISYPFYIFFFLALLITLRLSFDKYLIVLFGLLILGGVYAKVIMGLSFIPFFKQLTPIIIIYTVVSYIVRKNDVKDIFKLYIKFAVVSAILGLIQLVLKIWGFKFLTDFSWYNIDSVAEEPSHFAVILLPAVIYTLQKFKQFKKEFFLLFIVMILTFNLTAYFVFGLMSLIIYRKIHYLLLILPLVVIIGNFLYVNDPLIQFRIDETVKYLVKPDIRNTHGTPLSFFSNFQVATFSVSKNPISGSGLGGHEEMYYRYFANNPFSELSYLFGLNAKSAHSLIIRIFSELGFIGFILFLYSIFRVFAINHKSEFYIIGVSCLSHFMCKTLKLGNYFDLGTPFFFLIAIYCYYYYFKKYT